MCEATLLNQLIWDKLAMMRFGVLVFIALGCSSTPTTTTHGWSTTTPLPTPLFESYLTTDGAKLVFLGGISGVEGDLSTARPSTRVLFLDPIKGVWVDGPSLPADAPKHHLTVATIGSEIYVVGGFDGILDSSAHVPFIPVANAYVLTGGAWKRLAPQPLARGAATAQAINGKIYVTGGSATEGVAPFSDTFEYDPKADVWTRKANIPTAREHLASCALDGKMIVVGGWVGPDDFAQSTVESYDPTTDGWTKLPDMSVARGGLAAITFQGACHALGGEDWKLPFPGTFTTHESLKSQDSAWTLLAPMPKARHGIGVAVLGGHVYVAGGGPGQGNTYTDEVDVFTP